MPAQPDLSIVSLRGGQNDSDVPSALPDDQAVSLMNVETFYSTMGERRNGCAALLSMVGSGLNTLTYIVHISQYFPGNTVSNPSVLVVGANLGGTSAIAVENAGVWTPITPTDGIVQAGLEGGGGAASTAPPNIFDITSQDLNSKDFLAYNSGLDRLHCWDGTTLRRTGLAQPAAPTAAAASPAASPPALITHVAAASSTGNSITSSAVNTTGASFLVMVVANGGYSTPPVISDSKGNTWQSLTPEVNGVRVAIWYSFPATVGAGHTFTATTTATAPSFCLQAWDGSVVQLVDQQNGAGTNMVALTSLHTGGITPQTNTELIIAALANGVTVSGWGIDTGFVLGDTNALVIGQCYGSAIGYFIQPVSAEINPNWSWTTPDENAAASIASFSLTPASYTGTRYFRIRYIAENATGQVLRRSEPSNSVMYAVEGVESGATVTRPALLGEGETHWELEASQDNATFYKMQTVPVATTTATDTTSYIATYEPTGSLSEAIGTYLTEPSVKFLSVDGDRLLMGGHWTDATRQSRVYWSPVFNDPGVGNDERVPLSSNNYFDLDNYTGGPLTGIASCGYGTWYAFKWGRIYVLTRTNNVTNAYALLTLTTKTGAINGSIVSGVDEVGNACVFFLDPTVGPCRVSPNNGLQVIQGLRTTWTRVNRSATQIIARGCYYPLKQQVHWWVAADGNNLPSLKLVLQVSSIQYLTTGGIGRGWSLANGLIAQATAVGMITESVTVNGESNLIDRPVIGLVSPYYLQTCDTPGVTTDAGVAYAASITTKAYLRTGLLNKWGAMAAALLASAIPTGFIQVSVTRDFGAETIPRTTSLAAIDTESYVTETFDDLGMADAIALQFTFADCTVLNSSPVAFELPAGQWQLHRFDVKNRVEGRA